VNGVLADLAAKKYGAIDGVAVVRFGHLVVERYFGWNATQAHTMQSVSKSVTSLLFGIALDSLGDAARVDRPVLDVLHDYTAANLSDDKRALTIRHLLTMRTGMDFWEQPYAGSPLDQMNRSSGDWVQFVLDRPMTSPPDAVWAYNSGAAILVCGAIRALTGEAVNDFARRELFTPLGITGQFWFVSPYDGLPHCGGGLNLRLTELARIGYLVLRKGRWGDRQIVSEAWIDASTRAYSRGAPVFFSSFNAGYGYFWWILPSTRGGSDSDVITASGSGGQWLFVIPRLDLVVAVIASNGDGLNLLYDGILPAISSSAAAR